MRLFIGIPVPPSATYASVQAELAALVPGVRLGSPGNEHITVRFIGEVFDAAPVIAALDAACRGRPKLPAVVEGLGTFPGGRFPADKKARVAWAGVRAPGVEALADAVIAATAKFGEPPEPREFVAHVTLARLPRPTDLRLLVERHRQTLFAQGALDRVVLFRSDLGPTGPRYDRLHEAVLGAVGR